MTVEIHEPQFHRNTSTGLCRGLCTCGWVKFGTMDECRLAFATHDLDWEAVEVAPQQGERAHA